MVGPRVIVPAHGLSLVGGASGSFAFVWPVACQVAAMFFAPQNPAGPAETPDQWAALELAMIDEDGRQLVADGQGGSLYVPALLLSGLGRRWFPIDRPVRAGDKWSLTIRNQTANVTPTVPIFAWQVDP